MVYNGASESHVFYYASRLRQVHSLSCLLSRMLTLNSHVVLWTALLSLQCATKTMPNTMYVYDVYILLHGMAGCYDVLHHIDAEIGFPDVEPQDVMRRDPDTYYNMSVY